MQDFERDIRELREKTRRNRVQFLATDLQTCRLTIERAHLELSLGNHEEAQKEYAVAERGAEVIQGFLTEEGGEMPEIEAGLRDLVKSLAALRSLLASG